MTHRSPDTNSERGRLEARDAEISEELREIFGNNGETPFDIKLDEEGKIVALKINQVEEGRGRLGEILQEEARAHNQAHKAKEAETFGTGEFGAPKGHIERNDTWLIDAYNSNEEVKSIIDRALPLLQERDQIRNEMGTTHLPSMAKEGQEN